MFSNEHNLLAFSRPQSYALLSTESEAADAANNKKRLGVSHDMCGSVPGYEVLFFVEKFPAWASPDLGEGHRSGCGAVENSRSSASGLNCLCRGHAWPRG